MNPEDTVFVSAASPELRVRADGAGGTERTLRPGTVYRIGRDPESDVVVDNSWVSWRHATLRADGDRWLLEDLRSTNGTFAGQDRVRELAITGSCQIRLGHPDDGPALVCSVVAPSGDASAAGGITAAVLAAMSVPLPAPGTAPQHSAVFDRPPTSVMRLPARVLRIGRADDNDVVLPDLQVSRYHAELQKIPDDGFQLADVGSHNGTYVNGRQIDAPVPVTESDVIGIGRSAFRLTGDTLQEFTDTGDVSLVAQGLTVRLPGGKVILDDVSFPLAERCLLGVIGPSGAGKSTLLGALTGMRPASEGTVLYDGRDLYRNYAELRHRIGLVPQENILHTQLSARRALGYAAELRFPRDASPAERERRIDEVLGELSLTAHAATRTSALSGGQQKRVNVALELLTKPSLLFLDEPTSGLDPGLDLQVMDMMAGLARDGRTVIVVTHSVANLDVCDRLLVLVPGGRVAYFGPPADGLRHFGKAGWAQVFRAFEDEPERDWAGEYARSEYFARHIAGLSAAGPVPGTSGREVPPAPPARKRVAQLATLIRRYLAVISSDRNYVAVLALLPVVLGALIRAIPDPGGLAGVSNGNAAQVLLILIMGACLTGVANSVRELVKERPIYTRERAAGLSAGSYLWSKLAVLGVISALQAVVIVVIGLAGRTLPPAGSVLTSLPLVEIMLAIAVLAVASMTAGLLISAWVSSSDKTMPLLVVVVLLEVVLSGGVFHLNGKAGLEQLSWLSPSRWGFAAAASTTNLNHVTPPPPGSTPDPIWQHNAGTWLRDMGLQLVLAAVLAALTWWRLARTGPGRRR